MEDSLKKLKKLSELMRKQGILTYKTQEIEIQLSPAALDLPDTQPNDNQETKIEDDLTPEQRSEQALFWSTPGTLPTEN